MLFAKRKLGVEACPRGESWNPLPCIFPFGVILGWNEAAESKDPSKCSSSGRSWVFSTHSISSGSTLSLLVATEFSSILLKDESTGRGEEDEDPLLGLVFQSGTLWGDLCARDFEAVKTNGFAEGVFFVGVADSSTSCQSSIVMSSSAKSPSSGPRRSSSSISSYP